MLVLDESNLEQALAENDVLLLEFFAPWCSNCQRLRPRYARAATALAGEGSAARLAKVCVFCLCCCYWLRCVCDGVVPCRAVWCGVVWCCC